METHPAGSGRRGARGARDGPRAGERVVLRRGRTSASPPLLCSPSRGRPGGSGAGVSTGASGQAPIGGGAWGFRTMGSGQPAAAAWTIAMSRTLFMASWARRDVRGVSIVGAIRPDPHLSSVPQRRCLEAIPRRRHASRPRSRLSARVGGRGKPWGWPLELAEPGAAGGRRSATRGGQPGGRAKWKRDGFATAKNSGFAIAPGWSNLLEPRAGCPQSLHAVTSKSSGAYCRTRLCIICFLCAPSLPWRS